MGIAVVVDTNVIFAALIRSGGLNRYVLTLYPELFPFFYPLQVRDEIINHIDELARKAKLNPEEIKIAMDVIFEPMTLIQASQLTPYKSRAIEYVHDVSDAPFVACALMLKRKYDNVIILTWNVGDYKVGEPEKLGIRVITPVEFLRWAKEHGKS